MLNSIGQILGEYGAIMLIAMGFIMILTLIFTFTNTAKINSLIKRYNKLTDQFDNPDLEKIIVDYYKRTENVAQQNAAICRSIEKLEKKLTRCFQKMGIVRYDAFENVSNEMSFSVAMLDQHDDGFVINAIHSRETSHIYIKSIEKNTSKIPLSAEEMQAVDIARRKHNEKAIT